MIEKLSKDNQILPLNFLFDFFDTKLFISRSIKEIVSGYYDPLMDMAMMYSPERIASNQFSINLNVNIDFFKLLYNFVYYVRLFYLVLKTLLAK